MRAPFDPSAVLARLTRGDLGCDVTPMRIDSRGTWHHEGRPIGRPEIVRLLATILHRAADGRFWLVTPVEQVPVIVEDAPLLAIELAIEGDGADRALRLRTNTGDWLTLGAEHPLVMRPGGPAGELRPYVEARPGIEARLTTGVYYAIVELAEPLPGAGEGWAVASAGRIFPLTAATVPDGGA